MKKWVSAQDRALLSDFCRRSNANKKRIQRSDTHHEKPKDISECRDNNTS